MLKTFIMRFAFVILLFSVSLFTRNNSAQDNKKFGAFECGFDPLTSSREAFSIRFFLIIVLFLIFDVETVLIIPILRKLQAYTNPHIALYFIIFLFVLLLGLLYEWYQGSLNWHK